MLKVEKLQLIILCPKNEVIFENKKIQKHIRVYCMLALATS